MSSERDERISMIRESAAAIVPPDGGLARPRALRFGDHDFDRAVWKEMAALGWPALLVPEATGGIGMGMSELAALTEMLGRGLAPEPLVDAAIAAPLLSGDDRDALLAGDKALRVVLEPEIDVRDGKLSASARGVLGARDCDLFLLTAGEKAWLVTAAAPGVVIDSVATQDGGTIASFGCKDTPSKVLEGDASSLHDAYALSVAAYLLGVADRALEITLDHLRTRQQFGRPIGSFQALQHRAADLLVQLELCRASVSNAARTFDDQGGRKAASAVARAKARASDVAMLITRQSVQLHGGIGFADESDIGLYLRKAMTLVNQGGSPSFHRKRYAALLAA